MAYTEVVTTLGAIASAYATSAGASNTTTFQITPAGGSAVTFTFASGVGIRSIASRTGFVRVYDPTANNASAATTANLPQLQLASIVAHGQYDDARPWYRQGGVVGATTGTLQGVTGQDVWGALDQGQPVWGMIEIRPTWSSANLDTVDTASVQTFKGDALTQIVLTHD